MMRLLLLTFLISLLLPYSSSAQEYSYTHYDINEGLAGSTVYCITQDKDGFIWAGTETGLSRFDGTHFKNFTTADGLPDVEILEIFGDSKGRVWMAPFGNSVCYYYHNKIYNQDNDSLLKKVRLSGNIVNFAEDKEGNILIQEKHVLHLLENDGRVKEFDSVKNNPIIRCSGICTSPSGHFFSLENETLCELSKDTVVSLVTIKNPQTKYFPSVYQALNASWIVWRSSLSGMRIRSISTGKEIHAEFPWDLVSYSFMDDSLIYLNETGGSVEYNVHTGEKRSFLPGIEVSRTFRDDEGNLWFTTIGHGIFRLNSDEFRNLDLVVNGWGKCPVFSIHKSGNEVYIGSSRQIFFVCSFPGLSYSSYYSSQKRIRNRILFLDTDKNGTVLAGADNGIGKLARSKGSHEYTVKAKGTVSVKNIFRKNDRELLIAGSEGCIVFDLQTFRSKDTIFHGRTTSVYFRRDTTYIGTLNGLFSETKDKSITYLGDKIPLFKNRIAAIAGSGDSILWVASYDAGIAGYKNGRIVAAMDHAHGLTSNICRTLLVYNSVLWVGTEKGLNKIDLGKPGYPITRYTSNDGLGSDIINTVFVDSNRVYVGTPAGLSIFDEANTHITPGSRLSLLSVMNSGKERLQDTADLLFPYTDNNARFEFAGISYKSVGDITYSYRMMGLDNSWRTTKESFLEYPSIPSGSYTFQLQAINKFGVASKILSLDFVVTTPFWRTAWFYGLIILAFLSLTWLFVSLRIKNIRRRQAEEEKLSKKMIEIEQMALRAQMNPHFIFNCLNSIQQYIFDQDIFAANKYITGFARLIRATLQHSTQAYIGLDEELGFLSTYLSLEKLRFKEKMDFSVEADPSLKIKDIYIPPMLIQPYVENSMRHGLRHKTDGKGLILIRVVEANGKLEFTIEDNGIGREKAAQFKTREHIEYQSKGMSMTADRIRLINSMYEDSISTEVIDLKNEWGQAIGTRVVIQFPNFDNTAQKENTNQKVNL